MFRSFKSILSLGRLPLRVEHQRQHGQIQNIARARFTKPWKATVKKVLINGVAFYVAFQVYKMAVVIPLEKLDLEDVPENDDELEPLFIPFLGTAKLLKPVPYAASDPEWKAFVKFSKDKEAGKRVRDELAAHVLKTATSHPMLLRYGKDMRLRRSWLDIDFPPHPPPEYERSGIEFGDDDIIRWTSRKTDALTVHRIQSILFPKAVMQSTWAFLKVVGADELAKVANFLGFRSSPPPPSLEQFLARHQQFSKPPQMPSENGPPPQPTAIGNGTKTIGPGNNTDKSALTQTRDQQEVEIGPITQQSLEISAYFYRPILAFKTKLAQTWRPVPGFPPKGSIIVSGLVEVDSPKAWLVFDVRAAYDPTERSFDARSMHVSLRRLQPKKQGPAGPSVPQLPSLPAGPPQAGRPY